MSGLGFNRIILATVGSKRELGRPVRVLLQNLNESNEGLNKGRNNGNGEGTDNMRGVEGKIGRASCRERVYVLV